MVGRVSIVLSTAMIMLLSEAVAREDEPWKKVLETDDGVVVFMRETPGTTVKEARAVLKIAAPPRHVLDAACDPKSFKKSLKYVKEQRYYWIGDPDVWFTYQLLDFPVVTMRDYTMRYTRRLDPAGNVYRLSWDVSKKKGPPPREDAIRVTMATGGVEIFPEDGGKSSRLTFRVLADPGGWVPGWVMNLANRRNLPDIVREIRDAALKRARRCAKGDCRYWDATGHNY